MNSNVVIRKLNNPPFSQKYLYTTIYSDDVWPASATRSEDFLSLLDNFEHNKDLNVPIVLHNFARTVTGNEDSVTDAKRCF